jgi:thymidylate kinase
VERGYDAIAAAEPARIKSIDATQSIDGVSEAVWRHVSALIESRRSVSPRIT